MSDPKREPEYRTKRDVVEKHFEQVTHMDIPKYPLLVDRMDTFHPDIADIVQRSYDGLKAGKPPAYVKEGVSGTYFLHDPLGNRVSVFKPLDEEPKAINSRDRGWVENEDNRIQISSNVEGIMVGGAAARETAAYYLDHPVGRRRQGLAGGEIMGFGGVPPTLFVKCLHSKYSYKQAEYSYAMKNYKMGSLQMYMENLGSFKNWKRKENLSTIPLEEVQKLSVLDIRLVNKDRHEGNILVKKINGQIVLIPIDHGYCIPTTFTGSCKFEWLKWPKARGGYSDRVKEYVKSLDADQDIAYLKRYGFKFYEKFARTLCISTMLLKKGVDKGLSPFEIGNLMCTNKTEGKSFIKEIVDEAEEYASDLDLDPTALEAVIRKRVYNIMDDRLPSLTHQKG